MKTSSLLLTFWVLLTLSNLFAQSKGDKNKYEQDANAIKSMAGIYKVSFDFAETFASDTAYKRYKPYREWGIEYVTVIEESPKKIVLQHLLIVNDSTIIKHWRQDWLYENTTLLSYYKDDQWNRVTLKPEQVKGQWTQKVYQVDDSPRYEGSGTWIHVDNRHFWEATSDSPLPRREFTKRNDYNILRRHSHIEINEKGWFLEQDNDKIIRNNGIDKVLCQEKGMEAFTKGNYNAQPAITWWNENKAYWESVRKAWDSVMAQTNSVTLEKPKTGGLLWEKLFQLGEQKNVSAELILSTIKAYVRVS